MTSHDVSYRIVWGRPQEVTLGRRQDVIFQRPNDVGRRRPQEVGRRPPLVLRREPYGNVHRTSFRDVLRKSSGCNFVKLDNTYVLLFSIDLSAKSYQGLWFNWTDLPLFQNMSVKFFTNCFLSSGYNFKINYLKDKMRHRMWVYILPNSLVSSPLQHGYSFWHRRSKCYEIAVKVCPDIFEFKILYDQIIWSNNMILRRNMFGVTIIIFSFYC